MKHLKTYEKKEYSKYKVGNYIIWHDEKDWEILEIIPHKTTFRSNTIKIKELYYLNKDDFLNFSNGNTSDIDLSSDEERSAIKYVSNDLEDCKEKIIHLKIAMKYNL